MENVKINSIVLFIGTTRQLDMHMFHNYFATLKNRTYIDASCHTHSATHKAK